MLNRSQARIMMQKKAMAMSYVVASENGFDTDNDCLVISSLYNAIVAWLQQPSDIRVKYEVLVAHTLFKYRKMASLI